MKTLYERLKPEHKDALTDEAVNFPSSIGNLVMSLMTLNAVSDITYFQVGLLVNHLNLKGYDPLTIYDLFTVS